MAAKKKKAATKAKPKPRRRSTTKAEASHGLSDEAFTEKHFGDVEAQIRRLPDGEPKQRLVDRLGDMAHKFGQLPKGKRTTERCRRYVEEAAKISAEAARLSR